MINRIKRGCFRQTRPSALLIGRTSVSLGAGQVKSSA
jgi:hypothetical protein